MCVCLLNAIAQLLWNIHNIVFIAGLVVEVVHRPMMRTAWTPLMSHQLQTLTSHWRWVSFVFVNKMKCLSLQAIKIHCLCYIFPDETVTVLLTCLSRSHYSWAMFAMSPEWDEMTLHWKIVQRKHRQHIVLLSSMDDQCCPVCKQITWLKSFCET